jgi:MYXO-CTERM domain-containing protein
MRRILALLPVLLAFQVGVSPALAWTWPVDGPVLRPFAFDRDNPYAGGQHRGADIGADVGRPVVAPVSGTVTFAGTVPGGGLTLAVRTADGYSVTLVHLGSIAVTRGASVREGAAVGAVGSSGQAELGQPHIHLGVRVAADEHGYVDPLAFLPARAGSPPAEPASPKAASASKGGGETAPASESPSPTPKASARDRAAASVRTGGRPHRGGRHDGRRVGRERVAQAAASTGASADLSRRVVLGESTPATLEAASSSAAPADSGPPAHAWALVALILTAAVLHVRRQVGDATRAHHPAAVLAHGVRSTAEDAGRARTGEHDHVLLHGDLERILLAETKALPDLDGNDDSPELVDVADDAGRLLLGLRRHGSQGCSRSHRRGGTHPSVRSPRSFPATRDSETASRDDQRASV